MPNRQSIKLNCSQGTPRKARNGLRGLFLNVMGARQGRQVLHYGVKRTHYLMTILRDDKEDRVLNSTGQCLQIIWK